VRVAKDLVAASATPMVLGILAEGESYGYAILKRISELSGGELDWTEGLLYPLLHRLERLGYVESSWQSIAGERRRKYYRITDTGVGELASQRQQWDTVVDTLKVIWLGPGDGAGGPTEPDRRLTQAADPRPFGSALRTLAEGLA
jgi:PadR family transcriptional regulator